MKKKLLCALVLMLFLTYPCSEVSAKSSYYNSQVKIAIKKYKFGNYTGCIQDCKNIIKASPNNALAYYYLGMAYTQAGRGNDAITCYKKVLSLKTNPKLAEYAETGRRCLETPDKCVLPDPVDANKKPVEELSDIDKFIASPSDLSPAVRQDFKQKHLNAIKTEINANKDLDSYNFEKLNDASQDKPETGEQAKIAQKPSEDEIKAAFKVLNNAGINPYTTQTDMQQVMNYQNPEMQELNALTGGNTQNYQNNAMFNMLPYMLSQNNGSKNNYSPQLIQSMIMSSMMNNMDYNIDTDKDK